MCPCIKLTLQHGTILHIKICLTCGQAASYLLTWIRTFLIKNCQNISLSITIISAMAVWQDLASFPTRVQFDQLGVGLKLKKTMTFIFIKTLGKIYWQGQIFRKFTPWAELVKLAQARLLFCSIILTSDHQTFCGLFKVRRHVMTW